MSLLSKRYKQEIKFVNIFIDKQVITILTELPLKHKSLRIFFKSVFLALPQNVVYNAVHGVCLNNSVLQGKQESILEIPSV